MNTNEQIERRDTSVIKILSEIQSEQLRQGRDLATNTTKTGSIEQHLSSLNGKILQHESRLASLEIDKVVKIKTEEALANNEAKIEKRQSMSLWRRFGDKILWAVTGALMLFIWRLLVLLENAGHLKDIIK